MGAMESRSRSAIRPTGPAFDGYRASGDDPFLPAAFRRLQGRAAPLQVGVAPVPFFPQAIHQHPGHPLNGVVHLCPQRRLNLVCGQEAPEGYDPAPQYRRSPARHSPQAAAKLRAPASGVSSAQSSQPASRRRK